MTRPRRLAVTGASGFIGRRLVDAALARGIEVVALVRDPGSMPGADRAGLIVRPWRIGTPAPDLAGANALCHLAAVIPADFGDPRHAAACFQANTVGAVDLAVQAIEQGVDHLVYFSSGQVYAAGLVTASEDAPVYPLQRATYYLASKLAGELCVQALGKSRSIPVVVLRPGSVYGPGMHQSGMIPVFGGLLHRWEPVIVRDGGAYCVDFVHVDDVAELALDAVESKAEGVFNAGSGRARSALETAYILARTIGADPALIHVEGHALRHGFPALDMTRAAAAFAARPRSLEDGLASWKANAGWPFRDDAR